MLYVHTPLWEHTLTQAFVDYPVSIDYLIEVMSLQLLCGAAYVFLIKLYDCSGMINLVILDTFPKCPKIQGQE